MGPVQVIAGPMTTLHFAMTLCKPIAVLFACQFLFSPVMAQSPARKQVLVLGMFHFASNRDGVKHREMDVLGTQRQEEIRALNEELTRFAPQRIMVEWMAGEDQPYVDSSYAEYLNDRFKLKANEVYQLGYWLARELNTGAPQCIDAPGQFLNDTLEYAAEKGGQTAWLEAYMDSVTRLVLTDDSLRMERTITETLRVLNSSEGTRLSQAINAVYIAPRLGPLGDMSGAEFLGQWYMRNIRMYANICRAARPADERVLVIVGNGHRPIIEQLLRGDPSWEVVDAEEVLR